MKRMKCLTISGVKRLAFLGWVDEKSKKVSMKNIQARFLPIYVVVRSSFAHCKLQHLNAHNHCPLQIQKTNLVEIVSWDYKGGVQTNKKGKKIFVYYKSFLLRKDCHRKFATMGF